MRSSPTSSSSAASCASAVRMPCPISTLPGQISTTPSGRRRIQRESIGFVRRLPGSFAVALIGRLLPRRPLSDGAHDPVMRTAAAQIAVQRGPHLRVGRLRRMAQQSRGGNENAGDAIAALRGLLGEECLLQRMRRGGRAKTLRRDDGLARHIADSDIAGCGRRARRSARCTHRRARRRSRSARPSCPTRRAGRQAAACADRRRSAAPAR